MIFITALAALFTDTLLFIIITISFVPATILMPPVHYEISRRRHINADAIRQAPRDAFYFYAAMHAAATAARCRLGFEARRLSL